MKKIKISFLFLCLLFICFISNNASAQQELDSLNYYYKSLNDSNESIDLIPIYNFYKRHKEYNIERNYILGASYDLGYIAIIQNRMGAKNESEVSIVEALKLLEGQKNDNAKSVLLASLYNQLGMLYKSSYNYSQALIYYDKALEFEKKIEDIITINNNKANIYKEQGKYELAIIELSKLYEVYLERNDKKGESRVLSNLGLAQSKLNYPEGLSNILNALDLRIEQEYDFGIYSSYIHLTEYYRDRSDNVKALFYVNKALEIARSMDSLKYIEEALSYLMTLSEDKNVTEYKNIIDSINKVKQIQENKFASIKYDYTVERRKTEVAKLDLIQSELQNEKESRAKLISFFLFIIAIITGIIITIWQRTKHKKEKLKEVHLTENRIAKKLHDEVANDVYQNMVKLQNNPSDPTILDDLENIYTKTRDISKQNNALNFDEDFKDLFQDLILTYKNETVNIITNNFSKINWNPISEIKKTIIHRVVQELLTNMKKHSKATLVVLSFKKSKNKLIIQYSDNGIGCIIKKKGGLLHTENRIQSVGGTIIFESEINNGFKATIKI